jgi:hypothetical protein
MIISPLGELKTIKKYGGFAELQFATTLSPSSHL